MPENDPGLRETQLALAQRWGITPAAGAQDATDYEMLLEVLTERVSYLLMHRHQKLMASLYILDIEERDYNRAMSAPTHAQRAHNLARAILERETEKIASRRKYAARPQSELGE